MTNDEQQKLTSAIDLAWAAVEASGVPDPVRSAAFSEALRAVLAPVTSVPEFRRVQQPENAKTGRGRTHTSAGDAPADISAPAVAEAEVLRLVSEETGVSIDSLEQIIVVDDGTVKLIGAHTKFGTKAAEQARTVAQIVTVVRKLGMGENDTPYDIIRAACESKHCYDSKNFASDHLPKIAGFVTKGEKNGRRLEARGAGIAAFPALIEKVLAA